MDWNAFVLFTNWWSLMRTTLSYSIVSCTISNMLDYATLKMVQGNSETGHNVFKAPLSTVFSNIRFYLLCLFYCLWGGGCGVWGVGCGVLSLPQGHPPLSGFSLSLNPLIPNNLFLLLSMKLTDLSSSQLLLTLFHCSWCYQVSP